MIHRLFSLIFLALLAGLPVSAQPSERMAEVKLIAERNQVVAGEGFFAAFDMKLKPGWHVYWRNPGDSGLPPEPIWDDRSSKMVGDFLWPAPHELVILENELLDYGYSDRLVLPFRVAIPEDAETAVRFSGVLRYLICKEICIPEEAAFSLSLLVGERPIVNQAGGELIGEWIAKAPTGFEGEACFVAKDDAPWSLSLASDALRSAPAYARFFPYNNEIKHASEQPVSAGLEGITLGLTPDPAPTLGNTLDGVLVTETGNGARQNYRVSAPLCETALVGTQAVDLPGRASRPINLFAIAGLALMGGLILNLMPCVLPVLSIKAFGLVNAATQEDGAQQLRAHGIWYTVGVLLSFLVIAAVFVSLRAAGEFLSIGFQLQYPVMVSALALLMFVIGLWLLGMFELGGSLQNVGGGLATKSGSVGAFFTGVLAALVGAPCIGPFLGVALGVVIEQPAGAVFLVFGLVGLGFALPFLVLSFVPGLHKRLPKPGVWMERLKQFFAFPMFLTAIWLLSVLGQQAGLDAVVWTAAGAALIAFGIWLLKIAGGSWRGLSLALGGLFMVLGLAAAFHSALSTEPARDQGNKAYAGSYESEAWSEARVEELLVEGRGVFVDFTASWCATCQVNKFTTLTKPTVQQAFLDNDIVFMVADFTTRRDNIAAALRKHERPGVPMYLYYAPGSRNPRVLPELLSQGLIMDIVNGPAD